MALPEVNLKQAWLIPSATGIPNANGTAPGWWVDRPDGRVVVLLPGPPREMRPMWTDWALPRLRERGLGDGRIAKTLRTYGIGESSVVERLGEPLFRTPNPVVATYARAEWLDIRISAVDEPASDAASLIAAAEAVIRAGIPGHVWAEGETSWGELVGAAAEAAGVRFATVETGTGGSLAALLGDVPALAEAVIRRGGGRRDGGAARRRRAPRAGGTRRRCCGRPGRARAGRGGRGRAHRRPGRDRVRRWTAASWTCAVHPGDIRSLGRVAAAAFLVERLGGGPARLRDGSDRPSGLARQSPDGRQVVRPRRPLGRNARLQRAIGTTDPGRDARSPRQADRPDSGLRVRIRADDPGS